MKYYVRDGEEAPFGYGVICRSFQFYGTEMALIPFNYLYRIYYWLLSKYKPKKWEVMINCAMKKAYELGRQQGTKNDLLKMMLDQRIEKKQKE